MERYILGYTYTLHCGGNLLEDSIGQTIKPFFFLFFIFLFLFLGLEKKEGREED